MSDIRCPNCNSKQSNPIKKWEYSVTQVDLSVNVENFLIFTKEKNLHGLYQNKRNDFKFSR